MIWIGSLRIPGNRGASVRYSRSEDYRNPNNRRTDESNCWRRTADAEPAKRRREGFRTAFAHGGDVNRRTSGDGRGLFGGGCGDGQRMTSQKSFAVEIRFTTCNEAGVVPMAVKLQNQGGLAGGFVHKRFDVRVRAAFEVGNINQVQIGVRRTMRAAARMRRPEFQYMLGLTSEMSSSSSGSTSIGSTLMP